MDLEVDWNEERIISFFERRESVSRLDCEEVARNIVGNGAVARAVGAQGALSYTVECTTKTIMSFRQLGCALDSRVINSAKERHGRLIPDVSYCGNVGLGDETLIAYKMNCLPGNVVAELYPREAEISDDDKAKIVTFYKHLAGYFARNWLKPVSELSSLDASSLTKDGRFRFNTDESKVRHQLRLLKRYHLFPSVDAVVARIEESLPTLCSSTGEWTQVLTHDDFTKHNILIDSHTFAITGIVDWSRALIGPFGSDLSFLISMRFLNRENSTTEYSCWREMEDIFWDEFWALTKIEESKRASTRQLAETAADLAFLFRYGFYSVLDGVMTETVAMQYGPLLEASFGLQKSTSEVENTLR
ncbi:hypothetical protein PG987_013297 [Apiospora arundinis]